VFGTVFKDVLSGQRLGSVINCGIALGSANALTITASPAPLAYAAGQLYAFSTLAANTTNATLNVNSLGALPIEINGIGQIYPGALAFGKTYFVVCLGSTFELLNPDRARRTYTPTLTAIGGGSISATSSPQADYYFDGPLVRVELLTSFTVTGTITGVRHSLPTTPAGSSQSGGSFANDGGLIAGRWFFDTGTTVQLGRYDAAAFAVGAGRQVGCNSISYRWI